MRNSNCNAGVTLAFAAWAVICFQASCEECAQSIRGDHCSSLVQGAFTTRKELTTVVEESEDITSESSASSSSSTSGLQRLTHDDKRSDLADGAENHNRTSEKKLNIGGTSIPTIGIHLPPHSTGAMSNSSHGAASWLSTFRAVRSSFSLWFFIEGSRDLFNRILKATGIIDVEHRKKHAGLSFVTTKETQDFGKAVLIFMTPVLIVLLISACTIGWCPRSRVTDQRIQAPPTFRGTSRQLAPTGGRDQMAMFMPSNQSLASTTAQPTPVSGPTSARLVTPALGSAQSHLGSIIPNMSAIAKSFTSPDLGGQHLCPDLVVPEGHECTLLVPCLPQASANNASVGHTTIDDGTGGPVCQVKFNSLPDASGRRLVISSASGDSIFAYCKDCEPEQDNSTGLTIHHPSGNTFGVLRLDGGTYSVVTRRGWRLVFQGDLRGGCLNATDERGRLLAMAESVGAGRRSLRIGPLVDAGLVASALLGIDILEHERSKSTPRPSSRFGAAP